MSLTSPLSRRIYVCSAALCAMLLASLANAANYWREFQTNVFGYGGDYSEIVKADTNAVDHVLASMYFPIAVKKIYALRSGLAVDITSADTVGDQIMAGNNLNALYQPFFFIFVDAHFFDAGKSDPAYAQKAPHIFMETQSALLCPYETYTSQLVAGDGFEVSESSVAVVYCPEGGFPIYGEAEYWHGIQ